MLRIGVISRLSVFITAGNGGDDRCEKMEIVYLMYSG